MYPQHPHLLSLPLPQKRTEGPVGIKTAAPPLHCGAHPEQQLLLKIRVENKSMRFGNTSTFCQFFLYASLLILLLFLLSCYPPLLLCPGFQVIC